MISATSGCAATSVSSAAEMSSGMNTSGSPMMGAALVLAAEPALLLPLLLLLLVAPLFPPVFPVLLGALASEPVGLAPAVTDTGAVTAPEGSRLEVVAAVAAAAAVLLVPPLAPVAAAACDPLPAAGAASGGPSRGGETPGGSGPLCSGPVSANVADQLCMMFCTWSLPDWAPVAPCGGWLAALLALLLCWLLDAALAGAAGGVLDAAAAGCALGPDPLLPALLAAAVLPGVVPLVLLVAGVLPAFAG
mmetsp:Transcript_37833/g.95686  ORF Transcript_37833/g.95686 Transcript_37833/m.95686 type:complete len:248 (-) Transcript_37833:976-1719(-)